MSTREPGMRGQMDGCLGCFGEASPHEVKVFLKKNLQEVFAAEMNFLLNIWDSDDFFEEEKLDANIWW